MTFRVLWALVFGVLFVFRMAQAQELSQFPGVIHVHSTYSSGRYAIEELVHKAKDKGLEILVLTDHGLVVMEYGIFPLRNLIKRREERRSVLKLGVDRYLSEISRTNKEQKDVLVIPGVESSPFYYWTGSPFTEDLVAHDYRKELLLVGMKTPEDYLDLPLLHRGASKRFFKELLPQALLFFMSFILGVYLFFQRGAFRVAGALIGLFSLALLVDHHPFRSSLFDPYHGDQGIAPYQQVIDYVTERDGLVFWAHPESNYSRTGVDMGPIRMVTKPYPADLLASQGYTGFGSIYGDTITVTNPGEVWDQVLQQYCRGQRSRPVWGIADADFHEEKKGVELDTFLTIFLSRDKTEAAVLQALDKGKTYAVRKEGGYRLSLDRLEVRDERAGRIARMGDELNTTGAPVVQGRISASDLGTHRVQVLLIRGGELWMSFEGETPLEFDFVDRSPWKAKSFYRLEVRGPASHWLLSNPIFVSRS